jgi:hypothetical protein
MATVIKRQVAVAAKPTVGKQVVKSATKPLDGFQVVSIDTIEFLPSGRGGGKPMDPATQKLVDKALSLQIGQGIKIPVNMRLQREINGANGKSVLHTYKGAQSLSKKAKAGDMRFRTRRDVNDNLWLFRVEPIQYEEVSVQE